MGGLIQVLTKASHEGRWEPGIGDPTFFGWMAVLGYFAAAGLCAWAGMKEKDARMYFGKRAAKSLRPEFWFVLAVVLGFMGFNKQLDLQSWMTQVGRDMATEGGWYENRRAVQAVFVLLVTTCGMAAVWGTYRYIRGSWDRYSSGYLGIVYIVTFVVIRAASFHHVDVLLSTGVLGLHVNHVLELGGIGFTGYGAWKVVRQGVRLRLGEFERTVRIR